MNFSNEQIDRTTRYLARLNWSCILIMIVLLLFTSLLQKHFGYTPTSALSAKLYITAVIIGVIAIPISNRIFTKRTVRMNQESPLETNLRIYRVAFVTKLVIVLIAFAINLLLYYYANNPQLLIIGAIYIVYQMIAVQSKEGINEILGLSNVEKNE